MVENQSRLVSVAPKEEAQSRRKRKFPCSKQRVLLYFFGLVLPFPLGREAECSCRIVFPQ